MNVLEALAQQKSTPDISGRVICNDGLLSISDAVFEIALFSAGIDCIDEFIADIPLNERGQFLKQRGCD